MSFELPSFNAQSASDYPSVPEQPVHIRRLHSVEGILYPPCFDSSSFFARLSDGSVCGFSLREGKAIWRTPLVLKSRNAGDLGPTLINDILYCSCGQTLYQLEPMSGAIKSVSHYDMSLDLTNSLIVDQHLIVPATGPEWKSMVRFFRLGERQPYAETMLTGNPVGSACAETTVAIAQSRGLLSVFDLSGVLRWEWNASNFHHYVDPVEPGLVSPSVITAGPFLIADLVIVALAGNLVVALAASSGELRWKIEVPAFNPSSLALNYQGHFFVSDSNSLIQGDVTNGKIIRAFTLPTGLLQWPTRLTAGKELVWCNDIQDGTLMCFSLTSETVIVRETIGASVPQAHAPLIDSRSRLLMVLDVNSTLHRFEF